MLHMSSRSISRSLMRLLFWSGILAAGALSGCAGSEEVVDDDGDAEERFETDISEVGLDLASPNAQVRTIQLYRSGDESTLPFLRLALDSDRTGTASRGRVGNEPFEQTLTLEFDILDGLGRPLTVLFFHADRFWRRDNLQPVQYLASFDQGRILDYELSTGTQVRYTHYTYTFPNDQIQFLVSGNYILRVVERDDEREVLFERPFVISEQTTEMGLEVQPLLVPGLGVPISRPIVRFLPPSRLSPNLFDYVACFVRNARFEMARCSDRTSLIESPYVQYYLEPHRSFEAEDPVRTLDLTRLEVGSAIREVSYEVSPFRIDLEPDYALLGSNLVGDPLYGQTVVSQRIPDMAEPDVSAEYVDVRFAYVPPEEEPEVGPVVLRGSFNDWRLEPDLELNWNEERKVYETSMLLKQGVYEYQYFTPDRRGRVDRRRNVFNPEYVYSALMYFEDAFLGTDRLVETRSVTSRSYLHFIEIQVRVADTFEAADVAHQGRGVVGAAEVDVERELQEFAALSERFDVDELEAPAVPFEDRLIGRGLFFSGRVRELKQILAADGGCEIEQRQHPDHQPDKERPDDRHVGQADAGRHAHREAEEDEHDVLRVLDRRAEPDNRHRPDEPEGAREVVADHHDDAGRDHRQGDERNHVRGRITRAAVRPAVEDRDQQPAGDGDDEPAQDLFNRERERE